jgi:hypothetical protein
MVYLKCRGCEKIMNASLTPARSLSILLSCHYYYNDFEQALIPSVKQKALLIFSSSCTDQGAVLLALQPQSDHLA